MNKLFSVLVFAALAVSGTAFACNGNPPPHCECRGNQWVDKDTGNVYNNTTNNYNTNDNHSSTVNGVNGNVTGGTSSSTSSATGGNANAKGGTVKDSGNSTNVNTVTANGGQGGTGGAGGSANQSQTQSSSSVSGSSASSSSSGSGNVTSIEYQAAKIPVNTAYAASLTSGMDTCLGSSSGGVQTQILGISLGGTHVDKNCILIKQTQLLRENDQLRAACFRMQQGKEGAAIAQAMKDAGALCPPNPEAVVVTQSVAVVSLPAETVKNDPVVSPVAPVAVKKIHQ